MDNGGKCPSYLSLSHRPRFAALQAKWFNSTFLDYNERKVEMARARSADEGLQIAKDCPFSANRLGLNGKQVVCSWGDVIKIDLKEMEISWECVKRKAFNRLGQRRSVRSCVGLRRLGAASEYLVKTKISLDISSIPQKWVSFVYNIFTFCYRAYFSVFTIIFT